jgi:hypothetical protein
MWILAANCPDCGTHLDAPSGPAACETCWRVVPLSTRNATGDLTPTGQWRRLPPPLQRVVGIVEALQAAVCVAEIPEPLNPATTPSAQAEPPCPG